MFDPNAITLLIVPILIWLAGVALGLLLLWLVIRSAVFSALKSHTDWADKQGFTRQ